MPEVFNFSDKPPNPLDIVEVAPGFYVGDIFGAAENRLAQMVEDYGSALTVVQLAEILQCSRGQIYKLIEDKRLPALKVGSMVRLDPGTVADWIRNRMTMIT
jgi:excisionase family DNA binding protein